MSNFVLQIVKGIPRIPDNPNQTEVGLDSIDLLDEKGFSTDSYEQKIPALKSSVVWADSPLSDGRRLMAGAQGNVIETLRVTLNAGTIAQFSAMLSKLLRFKQDCNDYWDTRRQIEPIYLKHQVAGEIGARYALIYDIDIALHDALFPNDPTRQLTIVIERETDWRGEVAPGDNPQRWARFVQKQKWTTDGADILGNNTTFPPFFSQSFVNNKSEWASSSFAALLTNNAIKIPAANIPGDADALTTLVISQSGQRLNLFVGKKTINPTVYSNLAPSQAVTPPNNTFNAPDGTLGLNATLATDTGAVRAAGSATFQRVEISFAAGVANALRLNFPVADTGQLNRFIGAWMVFMRCRQVNGTAGQITMYLRYGFDITGDSDGIALPVQTPQILGTTGTTSGWGLSYMGVMSIPFVGDAKGTIGEGAGGAEFGLSGGEFNLDIGLFAARSAGTGVLYVSDLILVPYDEAAFNIKPLDSVIGTRVIVDNTGYFTHGVPGDYFFQPGQPNALAELSGNTIKLTPGVDNYIYILGADNDLLSFPSDTFNVVLHMIPKWSSYRAA